ncbi:MAG TPA: metalloregulator ArsR/SmtB family transcription factor [Cyclobacteriaceae bacterium]
MEDTAHLTNAEAISMNGTFCWLYAYYSHTHIFASFNTMALSAKQIEKISKALGDTNRLKILQHISKKGGCGNCADIQDESELAQPSVSHHIKVLIEAGLIEPEKEGRNHKYNLNEKVLKEYTSSITQLKFV